MLLKFEYQPFGRASPEGASAGQAQPALPAAHRSAGQGPMYTVGVQDMAINYLQMKMLPYIVCATLKKQKNSAIHDNLHLYRSKDFICSIILLRSHL